MYYTAPSFQKYIVLSEPYSKGGKMYIDVEHPNTHNKRSVRAYTAAEFNKAYPDKKIADPMSDHTSDEWLESLKIARGFKFGDITLVHTSDFDWLMKNVECRYAKDTGWYVASTDEMPTSCPPDLTRKKLSWQSFLEDYWFPANKKEK